MRAVGNRRKIDADPQPRKIAPKQHSEPFARTDIARRADRHRRRQLRDRLADARDAPALLIDGDQRRQRVDSAKPGDQLAQRIDRPDVATEQDDGPRSEGPQIIERSIFHSGAVEADGDDAPGQRCSVHAAGGRVSES